MTIEELITPDMREAWQRVRPMRGYSYEPTWSEVQLGNAILGLLAALLESEFRRKHAFASRQGSGYCFGCGCYEYSAALDPGHSYTWEQWKADAEKILEGKI